MYIIYYYDAPVCTVQAGNRADAVRQMAVMYGGRVGMTVREATPQHPALNWNVAVVLEPDGFFRCIDTDTYDCDCDQDGFFCTDTVGYGRTPLDAIVDLLDQRAEA